MNATYIEQAIAKQREIKDIAERVLRMNDAELADHVAMINRNPFAELCGMKTVDEVIQWAKETAATPIDMSRAEVDARGFFNSDHDI